MSAVMRGGTDVETGAVLLAGDTEAFTRLAHRLRAPGGVVELEPLTGWSSIRPIRYLAVESASHVATVAVEEDTAILSGTEESLKRLADEVDMFLEYNDLYEPGVHAHLELSSSPPEERLLAPESPGLILAGPVPDAS